MSGVKSAGALAPADTSRLFRLFVIASATTLFALTAALGLGAQQVESEKPAAELAMGTVELDTPVILRVNNHNWLETRIYAVHAGTRYRLGTVGTAQSRNFELPRVLQPHIQAVQILTLPIGSTRGYLSPEIHAEPGDVIALDVEDRLNFSNIYIAGRVVTNQ